MSQRLLLLMAMLLIFGAAYPPAHAQSPPPIDVFLVHDRDGNRVQVFFTDSQTGLSSIGVVEGYPDTGRVLEDFALSTQGVIFSDPIDGAPRLLAPNGDGFAFTFIPQSVIPPSNYDWVLSADGRTMAWAEFLFQDGVWQSYIYVAGIDGSNLLGLVLPPTPIATARAELIGVSNNGQRVFLDIAQPVEPRSAANDFIDYTTLRVYIGASQQYLPIAQDNGCPCPAAIAEDGRTLLQLERPIIGSGYDLRIWNLDVNTFQLIEATDTIYQQGGSLHLSRTRDYAAFAMTRLEGQSTALASSVVIVDLNEGTQRIVPAPPDSLVGIIGFYNDDQDLMVVDVATGATFKLNLETAEYLQIADKIWLGTLPQ